jgi:hypothetical protein
MRIAACLSWYDEEPAALCRWVAGVASFADIVVAVDGAYYHYPDARGDSPEEQRYALYQACGEHGLDFQEVDREPGPNPAPWPSEVDKRATELAIAVSMVEPEDWLVRLDADEFAHSADPEALRWLLEATREVDVCTFELYGELPNPFRFPIRRILRALPGLTCEGAHYVAKAGQRYLAGHPEWHPIEQAQAIGPSLLEVEHRHQDRPPAREAGRRAYYKQLNELELERVGP